MRYAVAMFYNNDLQIKFIDADNWKEALMTTFPFMKWLEEDDLIKAKQEAFKQGQSFDVKEIK